MKTIESVGFDNEQTKLQDWQILNKYNKINSINNNEKQHVEMKIYDENILNDIETISNQIIEEL